MRFNGDGLTRPKYLESNHAGGSRDRPPGRVRQRRRRAVQVRTERLAPAARGDRLRARGGEAFRQRDSARGGGKAFRERQTETETETPDLEPSYYLSS